MTDKRLMPDWRTVYNQADMERLPWYHPQLDPDVAEAITDYPIQAGSTLLDLGSGPGNQAEALRQKGFIVTGSDVAEAAIEKARVAYPAVTFVQDDILNSRLTGPFNVILDRGCFHVFDVEQRQTYVNTVNRLLAPEGQFWLKCFSIEEPGEDGPYRYSLDELLALFTPGLTLQYVTPTEYYGQLANNPKALFAVFQKN